MTYGDVGLLCLAFFVGALLGFVVVRLFAFLSRGFSRPCPRFARPRLFLRRAAATSSALTVGRWSASLSKGSRSWLALRPGRAFGTPRRLRHSAPLGLGVSSLDFPGVSGSPGFCGFFASRSGLRPSAPLVEGEDAGEGAARHRKSGPEVLRGRP